MAPTKRKRSTKHRGNAAGMIEARGRTGRRPEPVEKKRGKQTKRTAKLDEPPTWKGAFNRALFAAALVYGASVLFLRFDPARMAALLPLVLLIYVPLGYYTDAFLYRRRQRAKL